MHALQLSTFTTKDTPSALVLVLTFIYLDNSVVRAAVVDTVRTVQVAITVKRLVVL